MKTFQIRFRPLSHKVTKKHKEKSFKFLLITKEIEAFLIREISIKKVVSTS